MTVNSFEGSVLDRETVLTQFKDVFEGLGLFPGECTIHVDSAIPAAHPPRRVLQALGDRVKTELDRIERLQVITKVDTPTHWFTPWLFLRNPQELCKSVLTPNI